MHADQVFAESWRPATIAAPPPEVTFENLRKRGLNTLRFAFTGSDFALDPVRDVLPFLFMAVAFLLKPQLLTLAVIMVPAGYFAWQIRERWLSIHAWEVRLSSDHLEITQSDASGTKIRELSVIFDEVHQIVLEKSRRGRRARIVLETSRETIAIGAGLSLEALQWIERYLILELTGLTWRPLHSIDRRFATARAVPVTNPDLIKPQLAGRLIDIFLSEAPLALEKLRKALEQRNAQDARMAAHWLKSASANVGARQLSEYCQLLELQVRGRDLESSADLLATIVQKVTEFMAWLRDPANDAKSNIAYVTLVDDDQRVPQELESGTAARQNAPEGQADSAKLPRQRFDAAVLVVDDSAVCREIARDFLEEVVSDVVFARDGAEALELMKRKSFDLVLMDCEMYGLDGYQCIRRWRNLESVSCEYRVPVIATTGNALSGDRTRCIEAGMDDYLSKPFSPDRLHDKVEYWLSAERVKINASGALA